MSKRKTGLFIALGAALGAAAAGISYYLRYKSFNDELDQDFHDYEDDDAPGDTKEKEDAPVPCQEAAGRSYITLDPAKSRTEPQESAPSVPATATEEELEGVLESEPEEEAKPEEKDAPEEKTEPEEKSESAEEKKETPASDVTVEVDTESTEGGGGLTL